MNWKNYWWGPTRQYFFWYDNDKDLKRHTFAAHASFLQLSGSSNFYFEELAIIEVEKFNQVPTTFSHIYVFGSISTAVA